jgi:flagellar protein FliO/FliZ
MCLIVLAIFSLLLTSRCIAQTTAPTASPPPAIEGAYEHDSIRHAGVTPTVLSNGKTTTGAQSESPNPLDIRRAALALGIVLGLVFICRWAARWMFPSAGVGRSSQVMKVLSRSVIAPRQQLLLIQVGRRLVLVGDCGQQMNALAEISDPDEVAGLLGQLRADAPAAESRNPFAPLLGRAQKQFDDLPVPPAVDPDEEDGEPAFTGAEETTGELSRELGSKLGGELGGLTEKIRLLSRQLGKT